MLTLYSFFTLITGQILKIIALFNPKINLFVRGRKTVFATLSEKIGVTDKTIWVHCASLGEFEQGLPIIEKLKQEYKNHKIVVSFFSPSGYEVKKNSKVADVFVYLPLDTKKNAHRFLNAVHPDLVVFVKYEFWPNYLSELKKRKINSLLVSAIFRKDQAFFKPYGKWMQKYLDAFSHFFVQNEKSKSLLKDIGFQNVTISGDTRFDRVLEIHERDNRLSFIEEFKNEIPTIVYGSSWSDDEDVYLGFMNKSDKCKHIIAPHNIKKDQIKHLESRIQKKVVLYSEIEGRVLSNYDVLIIDAIGLLTKIYSYADIAFVGGAFKTGLHNVLEPAVFSIPIIIGPNYSKFQEAIDLVDKKGVLVAKNKKEYESIISLLLNENALKKETGLVNKNYIISQAGATNKVLKYVSESLFFKLKTD